MRCPDCNKFVPLDTEGDPEVELEADETTGEVTGTVRIVNACGECGAELTEAVFDVDVDFPAAEAHTVEMAKQDPEDKGEAHVLELEDPSADRTDRSEGKGRGTKTFYGAEADLVVKCRCGFTETKPWSDDIQASHMDEMN
jgi:hypothetical protein